MKYEPLDENNNDSCRIDNVGAKTDKSHKLIPQDLELETVLRDIKMGDFAAEDDLKNVMKSLMVGPKSFVQVKYLQWEKVESREINKIFQRTV